MKKVLIVNANYYKNITSNLLILAKKELIKNKIKVYTINVPGVYEIPVTISRYLNKFDGFIALACVIKGETPHFNFICKSTFDSILQLSVNSKKPIGNGIITSLNMKQAINRSLVKKNSKKSNKGLEGAKAVVEILKNEPKKY
tara:strand:+ start:1271 stop:1699 length:429 start_codon:yes stop_codon:yes gene_type:complete